VVYRCIVSTISQTANLTQYKKIKRKKKMLLQEYLEKNEIPQTQFSKHLGIHPVTLNKIVLRKRMPSLDVALRIQSLTYGKVTCQDLAVLEKKGKKKQDGTSENCNDKSKLAIF
jgi:DNA-binding transcriptional regulator YdaS (Cro superfamily)